MAHKLRVSYPGVAEHIIQRGNTVTKLGKRVLLVLSHALIDSK
ncbi:hypothetical protein [Agarivorans sp. 1_MG-2023]|nr:hypothetical protein [Agarivorans sp. 1_MG-2023]MDO6763761.1 hypothetical protein [Agarivorans sp. 1_MG-2023]